MAYNPPGVSVTEYTNPVVSPLLATADTLCLVGPTPIAGVTKTDTVTFTSPELLGQGTWSFPSTNWSATSGVANSYLHATGNTGTLTNSFVPTANLVYQVTYSVTNAAASTANVASITFGSATTGNVSGSITSDVTDVSVLVTASSNAPLTIVPGNTFTGTVKISIKQVGIPAVLPSIPSGGKLVSINKVTLASNAPSGNTAGTRYDGFTESDVTLTSGSATFNVSANNKPWAVGQTVTASAGIPANTKVTSVSANADGTTLAIVVNNNASASSTGVTLYVNQTAVTVPVPTQYSLVNTAPVSTTLSTAITGSSFSSPGTISVSSVTGFPTGGGTVKIDSEWFTYTGVNAGATPQTLTGVYNAEFGTIAADHAVGATVSLVTNTIARASSPGTIGLKSNGAYAFDEPVIVEYVYAPSDFYKVIELDTMSDIEDRFGKVYKSNGTINSVLSFAAQIAFENGADTVYLQPLFTFDTDKVTRKAATNVGDSTPWDDTFTALQSIDNINFIVPVVGAGNTFGGTSPGATVTTTNVKAIHSKLKNHLATMVTDSGQYIIGLVGHDGTGDTSLTSASLIANVGDLRINHQDQGYDQQLVFVSPTKLQRPVSIASTNVALEVGGQYAAVAIAAMAASREVSTSLTRKNVGGFSAVLNTFTKKEKNSMAEAGILVIEQAGTAPQVRHAVTTDVKNGVSQSELSVVRAKHFMMATLKNTVDTQIIGKVYADGNAPLVVSTAISSALETLKNNGDIVDFSDVQARTLTNGPTTIDVRFNYRPAFPVNYINIGFSIDLTSGNSTLSQANTLQVG